MRGVRPENKPKKVRVINFRVEPGSRATDRTGCIIQTRLIGTRKLTLPLTVQCTWTSLQNSYLPASPSSAAMDFKVLITRTCLRWYRALVCIMYRVRVNLVTVCPRKHPTCHHCTRYDSVGQQIVQQAKRYMQQGFESEANVCIADFRTWSGLHLRVLWWRPRWHQRRIHTMRLATARAA